MASMQLPFFICSIFDIWLLLYWKAYMFKTKKGNLKSLDYKKQDYVIKLSNTNFDNLKNVLDSKIGLNNQSRANNLLKFGSNQIVVKKFSVFKKILETLVEPFNLLLLFIGILELIIYFLFQRDWITLISAFIIFFMIFLASIVDFIQEYKAYKFNLKLTKIIENDVFVVNDQIKDFNNLNYQNIKNNLIKEKQSNLTIGDVVYLSKGDIIPSDCRIIWSENLYLDESTLTGESKAIKKQTTNTKTNFLELENILFKETLIVSGNCLAVVISINKDNYSNSLLGLINDDTVTDYEKGINKVTKILIYLISILVFIITFISLLKSGFSNWASSLVFGLSIAVSLTPEALPAIISSNLKLASKRLSKNKVVIKKLSVLQNIGSVNILATDKTGTLTLDTTNIETYLDINNQKNKLLKQYFFYNAYFQNNLFDTIDKAIIDQFKTNISDIKLIDHLSFDHNFRISSVLINFNNSSLLITKGSLEEILEITSSINVNNQVINLCDNYKNMIIDQVNSYTKKGYKVLVLSYKNSDVIDNKNLIYLGMVVFSDQIRENVKQVIDTFKVYDIDIKVLSGDNLYTCKNVCDQVGINSNTSLIGKQINNLTKEELIKISQSVNIFYKLSPLDKAKIIDSLKSNNVVGFLGDGVNDAVALKKADVGISVNNASSLAKQSADVILLEKDLNALEHAFIIGRKTFSNAIKYIKITVASNFGILLTLLLATILFKFEVMSSIQLLIQNLIFDFANLVFVFDNVDQSSIKKPQKWNIKSIIPFAIFNGLTQVIISFINFMILYFGFNIKGLDAQSIELFQTCYFIECILTHIMIILVLRTDKLSFFKSIASKQMLISMLFFSIIPFVIVFISSSFNSLGFRLMVGNLNNINLSWWFLLLFSLEILAWIISEIIKKNYLKIFKNWL
ncbi:Mg2+ transport ATPase, P-type 1 [Mycoplasma mycoides subsp. mycoides]|uniref:Magnesium-transporting ATPase, P-type 1 n=2 Tax=Mycoplasma mycoides subsp. mycoides TaxID=2103 RepID=Q6MS72_MYCMS|nr:Mg2+ transport ATPase, P-type 1 [Mycoplasma mycoides subsp. mycoides]PTD31782.1 Magnesium transporting ATPase, P-type 1 [Mycoplasma mycoides subsp. mycoides B345/93]CAE77518.1 Mg2+ transport ATPase, P-type 1 [Mycoplasma mycoides subsp. mycoides SC str. PG1]AME12098.1 Mg2+ transport ATPase, P-type 1 [Mycoplasma mycoides subsp. mycoides]AME14152.1 Mg2+ transport ATPase, P-type 1 [Mycoplasma mycoides subsp. mycoides]